MADIQRGTILCLCPECGGMFPAFGEDNVMIHKLAFHPGSEVAALIIRELDRVIPADSARASWWPRT